MVLAFTPVVPRRQNVDQTHCVYTWPGTVWLLKAHAGRTLEEVIRHAKYSTLFYTMQILRETYKAKLHDLEYHAWTAFNALFIIYDLSYIYTFAHLIEEVLI